MQTDEDTLFIDTALGHLAELGFQGRWLTRGPEAVDAIVEIAKGTKTLQLFAEVKKQLRYHQLTRIVQLSNQYKPLLLIADYIEPKAKAALKQEGIHYLETNGNMYLNQDDMVVVIEGRRYAGTAKQKAGRAFAPTGLRLLFHFLMDDTLINLTYRQLATLTRVGFGNINFIMTDLKEKGYLVPLTQGTYKLVNKKALFDRWLTGYKEKLKPTLLLGAFDVLEKNALGHWKEWILPTATCWGGEPAADLLTNYLHPEIFTLYTGQRKTDLIKTLRLLPAGHGPLLVYQCFWHPEENNPQAAPPLLIYADLLLNGDRRSRETAQKIFDEHLQHHFD